MPATSMQLLAGGKQVLITSQDGSVALYSFPDMQLQGRCGKGGGGGDTLAVACIVRACSCSTHGREGGLAVAWFSNLGFSMVFKDCMKPCGLTGPTTSWPSAP